MNVQAHEWSDAFLNDRARELAERIVREYEEDPYGYVEDGFIDLREEITFERLTEELAEKFEIEDDQALKEELWKRIDHEIFEEAKETIQETIQDHAAFQRNVLGYHGFSQRDFY
ncbi:hypothetical protein [Brevibacillus choshinensis]|uniref:Uncharacterized protein n=1 Tax=Brevibacillus choshinensis TaxID=54911 RepID=A0ABX7FQQ3_BRECH|nr:hypothetical protein [Brevibacillus choshinensis]QRG68566.1 hypothetical protein JNE38_05270 [Brevibacillus choshinensis]